MTHFVNPLSFNSCSQINIQNIYLTNTETLYPFLLQFLNLGSDPTKIPFASTIVIDNGLSFDRNDSILTVKELQLILYGLL